MLAHSPRGHFDASGRIRGATAPPFQMLSGSTSSSYSISQFEDPVDQHDSSEALAPSTSYVAVPPSPASWLGSEKSMGGLSDYSPSSSIASVRMAQLVTALPIRRVVSSAPAPASDAPNASSNRRSGADITDRHSLTSLPLDAAIEDSAVEPSLPRSASDASVTSWKRRLDTSVDEMASMDEKNPGLRPEQAAMARMKSILGPKMTLYSKAPWDAEEEHEVAGAARSVKNRSPKHLDALSDHSSVKENVEPAQRPIAKSKTKGRSKSFGGARRRNEVEIKVSRRSLEKHDLHSARMQGSATDASFNVESNSNHRSSRRAAAPPPIDVGTAKPHFTALASPQHQTLDAGDDCLSPRLASELCLGPPASSPSSTSLTTSSKSGASTPKAFSAVLPPSPQSLQDGYFGPQAASTSGVASPMSPSHRLISLEEARERERTRVAAAASRRMDASLTATSGVDGARSRETTADSAQGSEGRPKTLKPKRSGFLRRMMGNEKPPPSPTLSTHSAITSTSSPPLPPTSICSAASASSAVEDGSSAGPTVVPPSTTSRVTFTAAPKPDHGPESRARKVAVPSLSLRPISMAFSAGLPAGFLAENQAFGGDDELRRLSPNTLLCTNRSPSSLGSPMHELFKSGLPTSTDSELLVASNSDVAPPPHAALLDEYAAARRAWQAQQASLEHQVRSLQAELAALRGIASSCPTCSQITASAGPSLPSVLERPRFKGHGGNSALFASTHAA